MSSGDAVRLPAQTRAPAAAAAAQVATTAIALSTGRMRDIMLRVRA